MGWGAEDDMSQRGSRAVYVELPIEDKLRYSAVSLSEAAAFANWQMDAGGDARLWAHTRVVMRNKLRKT